MLHCHFPFLFMRFFRIILRDTATSSTVQEERAPTVYNGSVSVPRPPFGRGMDQSPEHKERMVGNLVRQARFFVTESRRRGLYTLLGKKHGPRRVALASFPRSGNTWVRHLLEESTGEKSGSIYQDRIMPRGGEGVVVKTHGLDSHLFTHAVHLVRNPLDAIESYYQWTLDRRDDTPEWADFVDDNISYWFLHTRHWLRSPGHVTLIRYEDLIDDTAGHLEEICRWLGYDLPRERIAEAVESSRIDKMRKLNPVHGEKFFRRGVVGASREHYTDEQVRQVAAKARPLLLRLGYGDMLGKS